MDTFVELGMIKSDTMKRLSKEKSCPANQSKPPPPYPGTKPPIAEKPKKLPTFVPGTNNPNLPNTSCVFENHLPTTTHYEYVTDDIHPPQFIPNPIYQPADSVIYTQQSTHPVTQPVT